MNNVLYWRSLTSGDATMLFSNISKTPVFVVFPMGVVEAHGPFLPLGFDTMIAQLIAHLACEDVIKNWKKDKVRLIIFDSLADLGVISATYELDGSIPYPGMLTTELLFITVQDMYKKGIRHFFIINGDGGTGNNLRALLFRSERRRTQFFGSWHGSFNFITWFDGIKKKIEHAGAYEHAILKYVCDFADERTRTLAIKFGLTAQVLTNENLLQLEQFQAKKYSLPRTEIVSWKRIPGQNESGGVASFSFDEYRGILESKEIECLWKQQLEKVTWYIRDRITQICATRKENYDYPTGES